ncbi:MAG: phytoene/squalene synthase family protein [Myxococcales bacterium]|nr:phytoene/squalene synthase family protein [Myxococcales bacterium]
MSAAAAADGPVGRDVRRASRALLADKARSFRWATALLPPEAADDVALVYAFCRVVDDTVDEAPEPERAARELDAVADVLAQGASGAEPESVAAVARVTSVETGAADTCRAFATLAAERALPLAAAEDLVAAVRTDLAPCVVVADDRELLRYCYGVAGTVGLLMATLLGARSAEARRHAIDLGIAMQLTNVCRDVLEDARRGRVYLPASRLARHGVTPAEVLALGAPAHPDGEARARVRRGVSLVVRELLALAERYYASGDAGLRYLPARARLVVLVASRIYRAIGLRLLGRGADPTSGRTVVPAAFKLCWLAVALVLWISAPLHRARRRRHDPTLHRELDGLAGAGS